MFILLQRCMEFWVLIRTEGWRGKGFYIERCPKKKNTEAFPLPKKSKNQKIKTSKRVHSYYSAFERDGKKKSNYREWSYATTPYMKTPPNPKMFERGLKCKKKTHKISRLKGEEKKTPFYILGICREKGELFSDANPPIVATDIFTWPAPAA